MRERRKVSVFAEHDLDSHGVPEPLQLVSAIQRQQPHIQRVTAEQLAAAAAQRLHEGKDESASSVLAWVFGQHTPTSFKMTAA